jgi:MYXO-CTERM domain-containing protein
MWDKALSISEAQAIGLTNVPEPASAGLAVAGLALLASRRRRSA